MEKADRTKTGVIFNIQKFSVNDGPGIRTVVFFKGCPLQCRWCSNPESQLPKVQVLWDAKKCVHCFHCRAICPRQAVSYANGRILIDHIACDSCMECVKECPARALKSEGETKSVQEILDVVMQDEVFYEESGGGITLSGGEMLSQPYFALELLKAAKEEGLHTCCETTGYADFKIFEQLLPYLDLLLFDCKHWDPLEHLKGTGVINERPLINMRAAIMAGKDVLPRIPVIPGFNDSLNDAAQMARVLKDCGASRCQLLPFHQFGENKYDLLGREYSYHNTDALHKEDLEDYRTCFVQNGIDAFF
ncbi:MAG: glycyl-radical enzyme activating protein [Solobacterium sp.]|nr:glycyl-radical enzyme activating protein [Solobacterium sp.]